MEQNNKSGLFSCAWLKQVSEGVWRAVIIGLAVLLSAMCLSHAVTHRNSSYNTVSVTGSGSRILRADMSKWCGTISVAQSTRQDCYNRLDQSRLRVSRFLTAQGFTPDEFKFQAIEVNEQHESIYSSDGKVTGSKRVGFIMTQDVVVESSKIDSVITVSRDITQLIRDGVDISSGDPSFYLTDLGVLKLTLIDEATANAKIRAEKLIRGFSRLKGIDNIDVGVFQITDPYGEDDYYYGGTNNTTSEYKNVSVTVHAKYIIK